MAVRPAPRRELPSEAVTALACRLLALTIAINALLAGIPVLGYAAGTQWVWPLILPPAFQLLCAVLLWLASTTTAGWFAQRWPHAAPRVPAELPRWLVLLAGLLIASGAIEPLVRLIAALLRDGVALLPVVVDAAIVVLRVAFGAASVLFADRIAQRLLPAYAAASVPAPVANEEQSVTELLGGLVNASAALGIRRATDLALSIKAEAEGVARRVVRNSLDAVIAAVELRRPDFSASTAADGTVTIVFSDMEGFTAMTERLGDHAAHQVIKAHNHIVRRAIRAHQGQEVELQGDGFLLAFADPLQALRCSAAIQTQCAEYSRRHPDTPIRVRIGLHCGTPIKEGDRFFGITVILAARIAAQAGAGEVLVSDVVRAAVGEAEFVFDACRTAELKGLTGAHRMHPLDWRAPVGSIVKSGRRQ